MAISLVPPQRKTAEDVYELRERIDRRLAHVLPPARGGSDLIGQAMRDALLSPGKRVRPLVLLLAARELGADGKAPLELGCALEMVHAASLVLDDMPCMDNARLRRGQPTVHARHGEDIAVLAAVALLSEAFRVVAATPGLPPPLRAALVETLAGAVGCEGLVRGQYEDLRGGARPRPAGEIAETNHLKTGALFGAALEMAARLAQASETVCERLREAAVELGQAFQLYDDLCDGEPEGCAQDKDRGKDRGKSTLVALLGREPARARLQGHIQRTEALLAEVYGADSVLLEMLRGLFVRQC